MLESRGKIQDIEKAKEKSKALGGIFGGHYSFIDIIFISKSGEMDLNREFIRLRVLKVNNRQSKNIILVHKMTKWNGATKVDSLILKEEFDRIEEAFDFIKLHFKDKLKDDFRYSREGWEYNLGRNKIFIEDVEKLGATVEIEAENERELDDLFKKLEITEKFSDSMPEVMRKVLNE